MNGKSGLTVAGVAMAATLFATSAGAADVPGVATSACMQAVNHKYGGRVKDLDVVRSEFSQANSEVIISADGEQWRCLVSNDGHVEDLSKQGDHHAAASSGPSSNAESACMSAVNRNYGGKVQSLKIARTEPLPAKDQVIVYVVADGEHWRCRVTNGGVVEDLSIHK